MYLVPRCRRRRQTLIPITQNFTVCAYYSTNEFVKQCKNQRPDTPCRKGRQQMSIGSRGRFHKLISSQTDALLAKEIFDFASKQPNFRHSYAAWHTLILKLGRSGHFSMMHSLLSSLRTQNYIISPTLFSQIIKIYGGAGQPNEARNFFFTILKFNRKPLPEHLNRILEIMVADRNYLRPALDLLKSAQAYGVPANTTSYNILMRAFCLNGVLSVAYSLFNSMFKRDVVPDIESYRILIQGFCRKSQVNKAVDLLEDMLNKGFVPDALSYSTLLNSLCRKKMLKEAYKLLCRMKIKRCNPDLVHYNTVIMGFCREGRAFDACKVLHDMRNNGCLPNLVSYRVLVGGLCNQGLYDKAKTYMEDMLSCGFSPHFSLVHMLVKGFCNIGKFEEACGVLDKILKHKEIPHFDTWMEILPRLFEVGEQESISKVLSDILKVEIKPHTRIIDAGTGLGEYLLKRVENK